MSLDETKPVLHLMLRQIKSMGAEMRNDRNDGWIQEAYKNILIELRDAANEELSK